MDPLHRHPSSLLPPQSVSERDQGLRASLSPHPHPLIGNPLVSPTALPAPAMSPPRSCLRDTTPCTGRRRALCGVWHHHHPLQPPHLSRAVVPLRQPETPPAGEQVRAICSAGPGSFMPGSSRGGSGCGRLPMESLVAGRRCRGKSQHQGTARLLPHVAVSVVVEPGAVAGLSPSIHVPGPVLFIQLLSGLMLAVGCG